MDEALENYKEYLKYIEKQITYYRIMFILAVIAFAAAIVTIFIAGEVVWARICGVVILCISELLILIAGVYVNDYSEQAETAVQLIQNWEEYVQWRNENLK